MLVMPAAVALVLAGAAGFLLWALGASLRGLFRRGQRLRWRLGLVAFLAFRLHFADGPVLGGHSDPC